MISLQRVILGLAIVISSIVVATPQAEAQDSLDETSGWGSAWENDPFGDLETAGVAVTLGLGTLALAMTVHDIVSFALDQPFDDGWAVVELVLGAGWTALGVFAGVGSLQSGDEFTITASALGIAFGATNITHAIWSLVTNDAPPPVVPVAMPTEDGMMIGLSGSL